MKELSILVTCNILVLGKVIKNKYEVNYGNQNNYMKILLGNVLFPVL